jgi:hypothetical protein
MKIKQIKTYSFNELSKEAQDKAISNHINFYLECIPYKDMSVDMKIAIDNANSLLTPWVAGSYIYEYCKQEIIDSIKINEYDFDADGSINSY